MPGIQRFEDVKAGSTEGTPFGNAIHSNVAHCYWTAFSFILVNTFRFQLVASRCRWWYWAFADMKTKKCSLSRTLLFPLSWTRIGPRDGLLKTKPMGTHAVSHNWTGHEGAASLFCVTKLDRVSWAKLRMTEREKSYVTRYSLPDATLVNYWRISGVIYGRLMRPYFQLRFATVVK